MAWIYKIENDINDKVYVGQTIQGIKIRYLQHLDKARDINDHTRLHSAMRELGTEHFCCTLLEECNELDLDSREKYWINYFDSYNNGYNMTSGGNGGSIYQIDDAKVVRMWDEGYSLSEIAKIFECSVKAISGRLSEHPNILQKRPCEEVLSNKFTNTTLRECTFKPLKVLAMQKRR